VAPSHGYYWNPGDPESTGGKLYRRGIRYANNNIPSFDRTLDPPIDDGWGIDNGVLLLDRPADACGPYDEACVPEAYKEWPETVHETHWENWCNPDPSKNIENPGGRYVEWFRNANASPIRFLPKNTAQCYSQWLYMKFASFTAAGDSIVIDNTSMIDGAYEYGLLGTLVLKVALDGGHVSEAAIGSGAQVTAYYEDEFGYGYCVVGHGSNPMGRLSKERYTLRLTLGESRLPSYVDIGAGTFNVFSFDHGPHAARVSLEMYGTQDIRVRTAFVPHQVASDNQNLVINGWSFDTASSFVTVNATGANIQGETAVVTIADAAGDVRYPGKICRYRQPDETVFTYLGTGRNTGPYPLSRGATIEQLDIRGRRLGTYTAPEWQSGNPSVHRGRALRLSILRVR
jgi:hypothetical protein